MPRKAKAKAAVAAARARKEDPEAEKVVTPANLVPASAHIALRGRWIWRNSKRRASAKDADRKDTGPRTMFVL